MKTNNSIIHYENFKYEESEDLRNFIESGKAQNLIESIKEDIVLVLGGDGSMISAVRKYHEKNIPFLGINFGHKGFLLNDISVAENTDFITQEYPLLDCEYTLENGEKNSFVALNDISIQASEGKIITLDISLSEENTIHIAGDGVLVSTPAGSTAYNSSLGGPIIPHNIPAFVLTPKAPWKPKGQAPILFSQEKTLHIRNIERKNKLDIYGDGEKIVTDINKDICLTIKKASTGVQFLIGKNYLQQWKSKVFQEQGFS